MEPDVAGMIMAEHVAVYIPDAASLLLVSLSCRHWRQEYFHEAVLQRWLNARLFGVPKPPLHGPPQPALHALRRRVGLQKLSATQKPCKRIKAAGFSRRICTVGGVVVVGSMDGDARVYDPYHGYQRCAGRSHMAGALAAPMGRKLKGDVSALTCIGDQSVLVGTDAGEVAVWDLRAEPQLATCMQKLPEQEAGWGGGWGLSDDEDAQEEWVMPVAGAPAFQDRAAPGRCSGCCAVLLQDGREAIVATFEEWRSEDSTIMVWQPCPKHDEPGWSEYIRAAKARVMARADEEDILGIMFACRTGELHAATVLGAVKWDQTLLACAAIKGNIFAVSSSTGQITLMKCELLGKELEATQIADMQMSSATDGGDEPSSGMLLAAEGRLLAAASWSSSIVDVWNVSCPTSPVKVMSINQEATRSVSILRLCDGLVIGGDEPGRVFVADPFSGAVHTTKLSTDSMPSDGDIVLSDLCVSSKYLVGCFNAESTVIHFYDLGTSAAHDGSRVLAEARREIVRKERQQHMQTCHGDDYTEEESDEEMDDSLSDIGDTRFTGMSVIPIEGAEYNDTALVAKRLSTGQDVVIGCEVWDQASLAKLSTLEKPYPTRMASVAGYDLLLCASHGTLQLLSLPDGTKRGEITLPGLNTDEDKPWNDEHVKMLSASADRPQALALTQRKIFLITVSPGSAHALNARLCIDLDQSSDFAQRFPETDGRFGRSFGPAVLWHNDGNPVAVIASYDDHATIHFITLSNQCVASRAVVMHKPRPTYVDDKALVGDLKIWRPDLCDHSQDMLVSVGSGGKLCITAMAGDKDVEASWRVTKTNTTMCHGLAICSSMNLAFTFSHGENRGLWWDLTSKQPIYKQEPLGEEYRPGKFTVFRCEFTADDTGSVVFVNSNDCEAPTTVMLKPMLLEEASDGSDV